MPLQLHAHPSQPFMSISAYGVYLFSVPLIAIVLEVLTVNKFTNFFIYFEYLKYCLCFIDIMGEFYIHLQDRILKSGGVVRVDSLGRSLVNGRLAMTRSLGDLDLKPYGVIPEPDTRYLQVSYSFYHPKILFETLKNL